MKKAILSFILLLSSFSFIRAQCIVDAGAALSVTCGGSVQLQAKMSAMKVSSPTTNDLYQVHFFDPETGYIAGENGTILRSTDGGISWNLTTFMPDQTWNSVNFASQLTGYIASFDGKIAKTTDGGLSWNVIYSDETKSFRMLEFISLTTGFAIGWQGLILRTTDGGASWNQVSSGTSASLNDIVFVNGVKGFICGDYGLFLTTTDSGESWSNSFVTTEQNNFNSIAFINENTGYITGGSFPCKTTDGGISWSTTGWSQGFELALWDDTTGFVCNNFSVFKCTDNNSFPTYILDGTVYFEDIECPDNHSLFAVGSNGNIYTYHEAVEYHWEPSTGLSANNVLSPIASPMEPTVYTLTAQLSNGLTCTDSVAVMIDDILWYSPDICMVTMDTSSSHYRILWNKPTLNLADSVFLYKDGPILGQPIRLAGYSASAPAEYLDILSNPAVKTEHYYLKVVDKCSKVSTGDGHTPVHLAINQGVGNIWNLIWSQYSGSQVLTYNVYRGTNANNLQLLTSVSPGITQYTDLYAPVGGIYYQIEAVLNVECSLSKTLTSSFSNVARYSANGIEDEQSMADFGIRNNPVTEHFSIDNGKLSLIATISLLSLNGEPIATWQNPVTSTFDISGVASGLYLLKIEIKESHQNFIQKLVKL